MRRVAFHPEAETELIAAAEFYEEQAPALGHDFIAAVRRGYGRLIKFPDTGRPFGRRLRRILVLGFPYGLLYRADGETIFIVAVMHLHRRPGYWRTRI